MQQVTRSELNEQLSVLKQAFNEKTYPCINERMEILTRLKSAVIDETKHFTAALNDDFGVRTEFDSVICDLIPTIAGISYIQKNLPKWIKRKKKHSGIATWPSKVWVEHVPKGVVGVIAPWNYPIQLSLLPVFTALAAGNRVMLKLSEFTPNTNKVISDIFSGFESHCSVVEGDHHTAQLFSSLAFDHLFFTGSTQIGKQVMCAAAQNLVPVTLELGGKSPVIIADDADFDLAAKSILMGKLTNAGQTCVAPDYVLVSEYQQEKLVTALKHAYQTYFSEKSSDPKLSSIINEKQYTRLRNLLLDAKEKGANIWPDIPPARGDRKLGLHLVLDPLDDMDIMQSEIFGPLLPIKTIPDISKAIELLHDQPRPLAAYLFTHDNNLIERYAKQLLCGSFAVNETLLQVAADDLPFGGIGHSGTGHYHGSEGFVTFSHTKSVLRSTAVTKPRIELFLKQSKLLTQPLKWLFLRK